MNLFQVTKKQPSGGLELKTFTGNPVTFTPTYSEALPAPFNSINLKAAIVAKGGGGTPSTPIPIVGYSEVNLTRCGKNLWTFDNSYSRESAGYFINNQPFSIKAGTYTFSYKATKTTGAVAFSVKDSNGDSLATINILNGTNKGSFTLNEDGYMLAFFTNEGGTFEDFLLELGSTTTEFEPYNSQTITLSLGQTVYGGRLYYDNGWKCDVTWGSVDLGSLDWIYESGTPRFYTLDTASYVKPATSPNEPGNILCAIYETSALNNIYTSVDNVVCVSTSGNVSIKDTRFTNVSSFKTAMSGIILAYELNTPFTIDLSSSDMLDAVVGINNVFSDCGGDVEVQCLI